MNARFASGLLLRRRTMLIWLVGGVGGALLVALASTTILNALSPVPDASLGREAVLVSFVALVIAAPLALACGLMGASIETLRKEAQRLGQRDVLTACLNEPTFSALVESYANRETGPSGAAHGTVLLINLDDLQLVNDRFGYSWGNEALSRVAKAIKDTIRQGDIVGRVSGSRFGVFLTGADEANARKVSDRIYDSVAKAEFLPTGVRFPLAIRAGAVVIADKSSFDDLLRAAVGNLAKTRHIDSSWIQYTSIARWNQGADAAVQ